MGGWTVTELDACKVRGLWGDWRELGLGGWLLCDSTENVLQLCMVDGRGEGKLYLVDIDITEVLSDVLDEIDFTALGSESSVSDFNISEVGGNGLE